VRYLKSLALFLVLLALPALHSQAQVAIRVGVNIGPSYGVYHAPPVCEWGFYPTYPFGCAPYGYYGPEWFVNGVFIGAGPWHNFYYVRPTYYRPYYFRSVWYVNRFHDRDRFIRDVRFRDRDRGFREFREHEVHGHDFDRGRSFHETREFHGRDFDHGHGDREAREFHDRGRGHERGEGHGREHVRRD
jgi:hypothetical protein